MEVLAGARSETHAADLQRLLLDCCEYIPTEGLLDFETAALLFRQCRRAGETIRSIPDCLIAAVAIRSDVDVLENDKDFHTLVRNSELRFYRPAPGS